MGNSPISLAVLSQRDGPGGHSSFNFCSSALPVWGKTHSVKSDPELSVFRLERSIVVDNILC
jgi:hypothetical protein